MRFDSVSDRHGETSAAAKTHHDVWIEFRRKIELNSADDILCTDANVGECLSTDLELDNCGEKKIACDNNNCITPDVPGDHKWLDSGWPATTTYSILNNSVQVEVADAVRLKAIGKEENEARHRIVRLRKRLQRQNCVDVPDLDCDDSLCHDGIILVRYNLF